jgi:sugar lactone lactonase YvrE
MEGIATDRFGNLYISQPVVAPGGGFVRRVDTTGRITTIAGGPEFAYVNALAFDTAGNLLVGDSNRRRIIRVNSNGSVTVLVGDGGATGDGPGTSISSGRIGRIAVDRNNNIYFTDTERYLVRRLSPNGMVTTIAGGGPVLPAGGDYSSPDGTPALQARIVNPNGLAVTPGGKVYFTDGPVGRAIRTIAANGTLQTVAGVNEPVSLCNGNPISGAAVGAPFCEVNDIALEPSGKLYVTGRYFAGFTEHTFVTRVDPNLNQLQGLVAIAGERGRSVTVDPAGNVYFGSWGNNFPVYRIAGPPTPVLGAQETVPVRYTGTNPTLAFTFTHPGGAAQLGVVNALINTALDGNRACYVAYSRPLNVLYLVNDDGPASGLSAGLTPGGAGSASNSQCTIQASEIGVLEQGNALTLTFRPSFTTLFRGARNIYLAARSVTEVNSGWTLGSTLDTGAETLVSYPRAEAASPNAGGAAAETVVATFEHNAAATGIQTAWLLINTAVDGRQACYVAYYRPGNTLYLVPDNGDGTMASSMPLTGTGSLENSQCRIDAAGSAATVDGNRLTLQLRVTAKAGFAGARGMWGAAQTMAGATAGWRSVGLWRVP